MPLAAASFPPASFALTALAERLASLWPFLLPLGALILAGAGLSLAQEASYHRALDGYRERVGAVVGHAWTQLGAPHVHSALAHLRCPGETAVRRRRRLRADVSSKRLPEFEILTVFRDPNFGQNVQLDFLSAPSVTDTVGVAAIQAGVASATVRRYGLNVYVAEGVAVATGSALLIVVKPAPAPVRLWLFRRWG